MPAIALPRARTLAWLPAAGLLVLAVLAAFGFTGLTHSVTAQTGTTTVTATVNKEVHLALNDTGSCGGVTGSTTVKAITGTALNTSDARVQFASCRLTFGTNNSAAGANVLVESTRTSGANQFCTTAPTGACVAPQFTDVATAGVAQAAFDTGEATAAGWFGIKTVVNSNCAGGQGTTNYYGLLPNTNATPDGATVCATANTTDGDITIGFWANPGATQPAGSYQVQTTLTASAI
ncbi:MAG: hypothetical protein JWM86_1935 [Thermoleophilia bacterium]|nr:hypothetical protein [Thermoleophilia bacterium]